MSFSRVLTYQTQKTLAFGSIGAAYTLIDSSFYYETRILQVYNGTDVLLQFSLDGVNDHFVLPTEGTMVLDLSANNLDGVPTMLPSKQKVYVKQIGVPSSGSVYVSSLTGKDFA